MADTQRSKTALATLFANNTSRDISPQDLRDFLESMDLARASFYFSGTGTSNVTVNNTYVLLAGTTTEVDSNRFTVSAAGRATYTGTPDVIANVVAQIVLDGTATNTYRLKIAKNGTVIDSTIAGQYFSASETTQLTVIGAGISLSTNDYLEVYVTCVGSTSADPSTEQGFVKVETQFA